MRKFTVLAVAALSALGVAQSPLLTLTGGTNQGNIGGGLYFNLQINTTVTITRIDFYCGANTVAGTGTLDVFLGPTTYDGNVTNAALWTYVTSVTTAVGPSTMASGAPATPFALAPGNYGVALKSNAFSHGYTNGVTCTSNTIPGSCANSMFSTTEMTLRAGAAQNAFLTGGVFTPRVFNGAIHYTPGGTPIRVASWQGYGQGCYAYYRSFYQHFPNPVALNLGTTGGVVNPVTAIRLIHSGGYYHVVATNTPVVVPTSTPIALASADMTFLASASFPGNVLPFPIPIPMNGGVGLATDLEISTDGYIVPSPSTLPNDNTPTVAEFLNAVPRWCPHWKNMDPLNAVSSMHVELDAVNGAILVTWNNVADVALTTTSTFQVAFYPTGDVEYRYGAMSQNGGGTYPIIIGWTAGGGALDPGTIEIATSLPFDTETFDNAPLTLGASDRPVLGRSINLLTDAIPAGTLLGAQTLGFSQIDPGLNLAGIGMPNCFALCGFDATAGFTITGTRNSFPLRIPVNTALNGGLLYGQSVTITPGFNNLGILSSNGVRLSLGSL